MKTNYLATKSSDYIVFPVAGAAYGSLDSISNSLTHAYDPKAERVLCGKVKPSSILEDYALVEEGVPPTCSVCAARLAKLKAKEAA